MSDQIIAQYGKNYRVVARPAVKQYGDTVFVQEWAGADWKDVLSYNTLSDDYAYSNAREAAARYAKRRAGPHAAGECKAP